MRNFFGHNPNLGAEPPNEPPNELPETIPASDLQETSIALWLLNSDISNPTLEDILLFARTNSFEKAREFIFKELKEKKLDQVYEEIERPIIPIVKKMQDRGLLVDKEYFKNLSGEYHRELDGLALKIYKMAGAEFNINSPKQLSEVLFLKMGMKSGRKRSAGGSFSTKVSVLEELKEGNPVVKEILSYRELQKLLSTYIDVIPRMVAPDGRLYAKFLQDNTTTGRFSSQDPNLQNLPIRTERGRRIRSGFVAARGHKLLALDYSQIELRVAAILSQDKKMVQIFCEGKDIHAGVASFVFGVPLERVDNEMRRQAKTISFGIMYGMGISALRKSLGGTRAEAQKFYANYFEQFAGLREYLEGVKVFVAKNGYTETLFGRHRYFPNINSRVPFLRSVAERTAINAPIQGTAADVIKLAIRYAEEDLEAAHLLDKTHLVLQVHDELVYEVVEEVLAESEKVIRNAMEHVLERSYLHYKTDVPLIVHSGSGDDLGAIH